MVRLLPDDVVARLGAAPLTYAEVGATRAGLPAGYHHLRRTVALGEGRDRFDAAAEALLSWRVQERAGVQVAASAVHVVEGAVAELRLGLGRVSVSAPVRVVRVVDEADRKGFAYGTLPGHPERGEEAFVVDIDAAGAVTFTVTAFSRPATLLARAGGPVARGVQAWVTRRYLRVV